MKLPFKVLFKPRYRYLLSLIRENRLRLLIAMGCMLVVAGATSATAFLVKPVLDEIFVEKDIEMLRLLPLGVMVIYLLRGLGLYGNAYLMNYVGETIIRHLRNRLYDQMMDLPLSFFQSERTGVLMSRITNDVNIIKSMVSDAVTTALRDVFTIIGLTIVIFYRDWKMALFAMIILPLAFFPIVEFGKRVRRFSTGCQEAMADLNSFLHETFFGNKIVKAFGMEEREKARFHERTLRLFRLDMKQVVARSLSAPVMESLAGLGIAFIIWYGGSRVINGASTPGTFFSFTAAVLMLYDPVKKLTKLNNTIQRGLAAADRVFDVIERESDIVESAHPVIIERGPHRVTFDTVTLAYGDTVALRGIDLDVREGEIVALVGESGGGKTSLVNLIPRFYDPTEGAVRIDGLDIREASIRSLRDQIAIVTQDTILFNDTVAANIAYGRPDADPAGIRRVADAAYALDFIERLPQGFDTPIGELGNRLSGGQRQRLCIARALLKDAPILILDEATSALDTASETLVQKALENLMKGRTTFVIAHRLSTISHAHRILVIVDGQIVEEGEHQVLIDRKGEYYKLHQMQFNNPTED
jgi:subfamily B ATP-binding cassette protein MsbA